ncbi:MAG: Gfo/Idh/MocA family oxidoreductase [Pseudomonadota bacterium]
MTEQKAAGKDNKKVIGMVGLGYWGKNILRNLYELGVLHTACDSDEDIVKQHKSKFPDIDYTNKYEDILQNPDIKAVAIASPAATHYEFAKQAILAGKDVFVEKPLSFTVQDGERLVSLADREKKLLMVGHILQFHPAIIKLKSLISDGSLGKIRYIYSNRLNIGKLRTEENILWSFAPHDISVILSLIGEEPVKVSAFGNAYLNKDIYDTTLTTLDFSNDIKGHIFVSWIHPFKEQKLIVVGSVAMAVFDDTTNEKLFLYPHKIEWKNGKIPVAHKADYEIIPVETGEPLKRELEHFIACVTERKKPLTDGYEGLRVLRILEKAEGNLQVDRSKLQPKTEKTLYKQEDVYIHETAIVDYNVVIGKGTKIWHFSHILSGSKIGENCNIGQNCVIGPDVTIGNKCKIQNNVSVYKGVTLEDGVFCGPSMVFTNINNPRAEISKMDQVRPTLVKKGATLGANCTIICGNTIGSHAFIGAGAVVTKDVPDYALVTGNPAKQIGWMCECGERLSNKLQCPICKKKYTKKDEGLNI